DRGGLRGGGTLILEGEEIVQLVVDVNVHILDDVNFLPLDGVDLHVGASRQQRRRRDDRHDSPWCFHRDAAFPWVVAGARGMVNALRMRRYACTPSSMP